MAKLNITLSIAGQSYPMSVDAEKEELYREAARRLNEKIKEFTQVPSFKLNDCVAMAALRYSILALSTEQKGRLDDADTQAIEALSARLDEYMR
ncbi:MAG: cell division protein ZapA [Alistipes sp.]|nr:cell division protein ZapA [Alistipes sp.]MDE7129361.1 cell division protein ZapA [Alistipes sp.]